MARWSSWCFVTILFSGVFTAASCGTSGSGSTADTAGQSDVIASDGGSETSEADSTEPLPEPIWSDCQPNAAPFPERPEPTEAATLPFLHVEGTQVLDEDGNPVALRGINFGSWLMMETWIAGIGEQTEDEIVEGLIAKASELGLYRLMNDARTTNAIEWTFYVKGRWVCIQEWREHMIENATPDEAEAVAELWAWFDEQPWIFEERSLWKWLTKRFDYAKAMELREVFLDHYVTELDVERVAALGLNLIRLPVWYQALETDVEGENGFVADGWRRLDDIVSWARKHGVYIMLDLHGAPGGQSPWWHQGLENGGFFWETQACVDKTARLWKALATYFRDEPHIAVYDLLNEPAGAPDRETYGAVHDALYDAIREVDTRHIITLEDGFLDFDILVSPADLGWENVIVSFHDYPGGGNAEAHANNMEGEITGLTDLWDSFDFPLFYGEFNVYDPTAFEATDDPSDRWQVDAMDLALDMMNRRGVHWAPWSWKYFAAPSLWGVYVPADGSGDRINVATASFEEVRAAFEALDSTNFVLDGAYGELLERNAAAPIAPLDISPAAE